MNMVTHNGETVNVNSPEVKPQSCKDEMKCAMTHQLKRKLFDEKLYHQRNVMQA